MYFGINILVFQSILLDPLRWWYTLSVQLCILGYNKLPGATVKTWDLICVCCVYRLEQRTWVASQLQMNTHMLLSTIFVNVRCVCYFVGVIQFARVASVG